MYIFPMSLDAVAPLLEELQNELFLYSWEIFELRIQEEMLRADRTGSGFGYLELSFSKIRSIIQAPVSDQDLWRVIFSFFSETMRGSDIKGFLSGNTGVGLVFLDADHDGVAECRDRLWSRLQSLGWIVPEAHDKIQNILKLTYYPLELKS